MKQHQHRPKTRAPHGSPFFPARIGAWVTEEQHKFVMKNGGSAYLRKLLDDTMKASDGKAN